MIIRNWSLAFLAAISLMLAAACSTGQAPTSFQPMFHTPLQLKLCPLPNIPPKKITSAPGFKEFIVTVTDRSGRPIDGLKESDFSLSIDGRPVPINYFRTSDGNLPTAIAIVVDSSGSMKDKLSLDSGGKFDTVREKLAMAARRFGACEELAVFTFGGAANAGFFHPFSTIQTAELFTTDYEGAIDGVAQVKPYGQTPLYDSMRSAIGVLAESDYPNRSLLVITDGMDNVSKATASDGIYLARKDNVAVSAIGIGDPASDNSLASTVFSAITNAPGRTWIDEKTLGMMTAETGGRFWLVVPFRTDSNQRLISAIQNFTDSIGHGYSIGLVDVGNEPIQVSVKGHPAAALQARPAGF